MPSFPRQDRFRKNVPETRSISENAGPNVALAADDKNVVKRLRNPLEFSAAELKKKAQIMMTKMNWIFRQVSEILCTRVYTGATQMMLQDYSIKHTNVLQNSNSLHSHVMINFRDYIDIYEYLDDACDLPTRKFTNDDVDKTPVADMDFLDQLVKFRNQYPKKPDIWAFKHQWTKKQIFWSPWHSKGKSVRCVFHFGNQTW